MRHNTILSHESHRLYTRPNSKTKTHMKIAGIARLQHMRFYHTPHQTTARIVGCCASLRCRLPSLPPRPRSSSRSRNTPRPSSGLLKRNASSNADWRPWTPSWATYALHPPSTPPHTRGAVCSGLRARACGEGTLRERGVGDVGGGERREGARARVRGAGGGEG